MKTVNKYRDFTYLGWLLSFAQRQFVKKLVFEIETFGYLMELKFMYAILKAFVLVFSQSDV